MTTREPGPLFRRNITQRQREAAARAFMEVIERLSNVPPAERRERDAEDLIRLRELLDIYTVD